MSSIQKIIACAFVPWNCSMRNVIYYLDMYLLFLQAKTMFNMLLNRTSKTFHCPKRSKIIDKTFS